MSSIEAVGIILGAFQGAAHQNSYTNRLSTATRKYREQRFGWLVRVLSWTIVFDPDAVQELQKNINSWTNDEVLAWKASYIDSCNAIAVAVSRYSVNNLTLLTFQGCYFCEHRSNGTNNP
jgi:hypothetical protein